MVFPPLGSRRGVTRGAAAGCKPRHRGDTVTLPRYGKQDTAQSHPSAGTRRPPCMQNCSSRLRSEAFSGRNGLNLTPSETKLPYPEVGKA